MTALAIFGAWLLLSVLAGLLLGRSIRLADEEAAR